MLKAISFIPLCLTLCSCLRKPFYHALSVRCHRVFTQTYLSLWTGPDSYSSFSFLVSSIKLVSNCHLEQDIKIQLSFFCAWSILDYSYQLLLKPIDLWTLHFYINIYISILDVFKFILWNYAHLQRKILEI